MYLRDYSLWLVSSKEEKKFCFSTTAFKGLKGGNLMCNLVRVSSDNAAAVKKKK